MSVLCFPTNAAKHTPPDLHTVSMIYAAAIAAATVCNQEHVGVDEFRKALDFILEPENMLDVLSARDNENMRETALACDRLARVVHGLAERASAR